MKYWYDALMRGVWGEHSPYGNNINYGGPDCTKEASWEFKLCVNLLLVSGFRM